MPQYYELYSDEEFKKAEDKSREKRKAIRDTKFRWTNKVIPYMVAGGVFSSQDKNEINSAIDEWQNYTCLRFPRRSTERNYIYINNGTGCSSSIGMRGSLQTVFLGPGCREKKIIIHEIGHAVGLFHEQQRF